MENISENKNLIVEACGYVTNLLDPVKKIDPKINCIEKLISLSNENNLNLFIENIHKFFNSLKIVELVIEDNDVKKNVINFINNYEISRNLFEIFKENFYNLYMKNNEE